TQSVKASHPARPPGRCQVFAGEAHCQGPPTEGGGVDDLASSLIGAGFAVATHAGSKAQGKRSPERPVLTIRQVFALADAIEARYRALILLAVFGSLRWGELAALRRQHIDLRSGTLRVEVSVAELTDGSLVTGPPKSEAGKRIVTLPGFLLPEIASHL